MLFVANTSCSETDWSLIHITTRWCWSSASVSFDLPCSQMNSLTLKRPRNASKCCILQIYLQHFCLLWHKAHQSKAEDNSEASFRHTRLQPAEGSRASRSRVLSSSADWTKDWPEHRWRHWKPQASCSSRKICWTGLVPEQPKESGISPD